MGRQEEKVGNKKHARKRNYAKKIVSSKIQQQKLPLEPLEVYWPVCL